MSSTNLFSPLSISQIDTKNRVGLAPMTRTSATESGLATEQMVKYYSKFARGGFGLLITEGVYPDEMYSQGYKDQPGIANEQQVEAWRKVIEGVHNEGAKIICQIMHAGALSQGNQFKTETIGPSAVKPKGEQLSFYGGNGEFPVPNEMTKEDIQEVIKSFVEAAKRTRQAGFDGIEIHGANGYILDQFLTDYTNQRSDEYGGSTENRVRILVELVEAVRQEVGTDYPVGIRISQGKVNDYEHKWAQGEKDAEIIFGSLSKIGVDFIHVTEHDAFNSAFEENGPTLASLAKKFGGEVPVFANGKLHEPGKAEEIIKKGQADLVTIGTGALANPDWAKKVQNNEQLNEFNPEKFLHPNAKIKEFEEGLY
jgi:2,4-dienoyl-CoA reductase-like NADH-dependent reductase (Old Yellow Enzyme family)